MAARGTMAAAAAAAFWVACAAGSAQADKLFSRFYVEEVLVGILDHDTTLIGSSEEDGAALNLEIRFVQPWDLGETFALFPTIGGVVSLADETDSAYAGLTLSIRPIDPVFVDLFFGLAIHDSDAKESEREERKYLGCRTLFREAVEAGVTLGNGHRLSVLASHMSHGEILCGKARNPGMDHVGFRYGFSF